MAGVRRYTGRDPAEERRRAAKQRQVVLDDLAGGRIGLSAAVQLLQKGTFGLHLAADADVRLVAGGAG